jgi:gamma-glutamyltranspeptidase/glutathione hydrolase
MSKLAVNGSGAVHLFSQAHRLAYADRLRYIRDPAFGAVPTSGLISPQYLKERARLIDRNKSFGRVSPGQPTQKSGALLPPGISPTTPPRESPSTTHIAVVDEERNAVSFTTTLGHYFGSKILVRGFLLNDSMNAFSRRPNINDVALANAVAPNKRPRSSMAPVIALDRRGKARLVLGSPGGNRIPAYVTKTLIAHLDWGLDIQAAIELSNHGSRTIRTELEADSAAMALKPSLKAMGHNVKIVPMPSGVHAIRIIDKGLAGGADLRREGVARGD